MGSHSCCCSNHEASNERSKIGTAADAPSPFVSTAPTLKDARADKKTKGRANILQMSSEEKPTSDVAESSTASPDSKQDEHTECQAEVVQRSRKARKSLSMLKSLYENDLVARRDICERLVARLQGQESDAPRTEASVYDGEVRTMLKTNTGEGLVLPFPLTFEAAETLRGHYVQFGASKPLHSRIAEELLNEFTSKFSAMHPTSVAYLNHVSNRLKVVGDLHGQLQDVLCIFHRWGPPTEQNKYIFNGNIANQGPNSSEIFFLLFAYFLVDPSSVIINRGNTEDDFLSSQDPSCGGGFRAEVMQKYDLAMYERFVSMMKVLPLCTSVERKVFVVHGGLSAQSGVKFTLDYIRSIDHTEFTMPDMKSTVLQDIVWKDMMWSDPMDKPGREQGAGCGMKFGPDISKQFLGMHAGMEYIIRSHELPDNETSGSREGSSVCHDGRVLTIFSASNYCGGNLGAVYETQRLKFPEYQLKHFCAPALDQLSVIMREGKDGWDREAEAWQNYQEVVDEQSWWAKELSKLMIAIVERKPQIWSKYIEDTGGNALMDYEKWKDIMVDVLGDEWNWELAWKTWKLSEKRKDSQVNFVDFLRRFSVVLCREEYMSFKFNAIERVFDEILHSHMSLEDTLSRFDKDGNGKVDMTEMRDALVSFDLGLSAAQVDSLLHIFFMDAENVGGVAKIDVKSFLGRFAMVYKHAEDAIHENERTEDERLAHEAMSKIGHLVAVTPKTKVDQWEQDICKKRGEKTAKRSEGRHATRHGTRHGHKNGHAGHGSEGRGSTGSKSSKGSEDTHGGAKSKGSKEAVDPGSKSHDHHRRGSKESGEETHGGDEKRAHPRRKTKKATTKKVSVGAKMSLKVEAMFEFLDCDHNGFVDVVEFVDGISEYPGVMQLVLSNGEKLTLDTLRRVARHMGIHGKINILAFLEAFCFDDSDDVADALAEHMIAVLFRHRYAIRAGARHFDTKITGSITEDDFLKVLIALNSEIEESGMHFSHSQLQDLAEAVASVDNGHHDILYEDLLTAFEVVDSENSTASIRVGK